MFGCVVVVSVSDKRVFWGKELAAQLYVIVFVSVVVVLSNAVWCGGGEQFQGFVQAGFGDVVERAVFAGVFFLGGEGR